MPYEYWVIDILKVVDGDTVDCRIDLGFGLHANFRFRLTGVDTPEVKGEEREAGLAAAEFTGSWLASHLSNLAVRTSRLSPATVGIGDGAFGRWLGDFVDLDTGERLAEALKEAGHTSP